MKKLLSVVAVAAIVTSAFAFSTKTSTKFCVRNAGATGCELTPTTKQIIAGTPNFKIYPLGENQWDGSEASCIAAGTVKCSVDIRLINN
jgi:hypothetical protein